MDRPEPPDENSIWTDERLDTFDRLLAAHQRNLGDPAHVELLEEELRTFPLRQRVAARMFFLGFTYRRIAGLLDISVHAARELACGNTAVPRLLHRLAERVR